VYDHGHTAGRREKGAHSIVIEGWVVHAIERRMIKIGEVKSSKFDIQDAREKGSGAVICQRPKRRGIKGMQAILAGIGRGRKSTKRGIRSKG